MWKWIHKNKKEGIGEYYLRYNGYYIINISDIYGLHIHTYKLVKNTNQELNKYIKKGLKEPSIMNVFYEQVMAVVKDYERGWLE